MTILPIEIPPGVCKQDSPNAAKGRYIDSDKVRFNGKFPEKWGGWTTFASTALTGVPRGMTSWVSSTGNLNLAIGTHKKLYVIAGGDNVQDVTPIRDSGTLGNDPFAVVDTSTTVTVTDTSHGVEVGAYVTFSGASAGGGITINGTYVVASVVDANSYTITHSSAATSTDSTTGGAAVAYSYEINIGYQSSATGTGWGTGFWGHSFGWGEESSSGVATQRLRHWSLAAYGHDLLASPFGGTLYDWDEGTDTDAQIITQAPDVIRAMFVTPERFVFALGTHNGSTDDPLRIQWPDQDDITDWTATSANTANSRTLQNGSTIVAGTALRDLISLVWTDSALYLFQYTVGSEFIYEDRLAGEHCGLVGALAFTVVASTAYWVSAHDFHLFNGAVQSIPNCQDIADHFFRRINRSHFDKTYCVYNPIPNTLIFGYVSEDSTDLEPDEYVEVSLDNFSWTVGTLERTCGIVYRPGQGIMVMADQDGATWAHESGTDAGTGAMEAYITFGEYQLSEGQQNIDIFGFVPDCQRQTGNLSVALRTQDRPNSSGDFDSTTLTLAPTDPIGDCRISGRIFSFTVTSDEVGGDFRLGVPALEIGGGGERR